MGSVDCTLSWKKVEAAQDLLQLFHEGQRNMVYAETKMNKHSSRSHAVLQVLTSRTYHIHCKPHARLWVRMHGHACAYAHQMHT